MNKEEICVRSSLFTYKGDRYEILGESNRDNLIPAINTQYMKEIVIHEGGFKQYIVAGERSLFDICIYQYRGKTYIYNIEKRESKTG